MARKKKYDFRYGIYIDISSDEYSITDMEILQGMIEKLKYLVANRSQIRESTVLIRMHNNHDNSTEMPF